MTATIPFVVQVPSFYLTLRLTSMSKPRIATSGIARWAAADYMGSAEFEWGAIPHTYRRTRVVACTSGYEIDGVTLDVDGSKVKLWHMIPKGMDRVAVLNILRQMAKDEVRCKESPRLDRALQRKAGTLDSRFTFTADIDTWCTVKDRGYGNNDDHYFYPVWFSLHKETLKNILKEASKMEATPAGEPEDVPPVQEVAAEPKKAEVKYGANDIRLFDQVKYRVRQVDRVLEVWGTVVEIHEDRLLVRPTHKGPRTPSRRNLRYNQIIDLKAKVA